MPMSRAMSVLVKGKEFKVKVRVHQGLVLNLLLFIIMLEALSC